MSVGSVLLFPGAGGDCSHHTLMAIEEHFVGAGSDPGHERVTVARRDFPYRRKRKGPPDRAPKLIEAVVAEAEALTRDGADAPVLGGRSMGGRMCSMAVAQGLEASGLVLLSYPLHPPGKLDKLRTEHFEGLDVPCLFISGTRDPFGTPDELTEAVRAIPGPVQLEWLDGQGHDPKGCDEEIVDLVDAWFRHL